MPETANQFNVLYSTNQNTDISIIHSNFIHQVSKVTDWSANHYFFSVNRGSPVDVVVRRAVTTNCRYFVLYLPLIILLLNCCNLISLFCESVIFVCVVGGKSFLNTPNAPRWVFCLDFLETISCLDSQCAFRKPRELPRAMHTWYIHTYNSLSRTTIPTYLAEKPNNNSYNIFPEFRNV